MNRASLLGIVLIVAGLGGYAVGVIATYPGRAFSVTLVMVGITLLVSRAAFAAEGVDP